MLDLLRVHRVSKLLVSEVALTEPKGLMSTSPFMSPFGSKRLAAWCQSVRQHPGGPRLQMPPKDVRQLH
jgi:hypothetical protein